MYPFLKNSFFHAREHNFVFFLPKSRDNILANYVLNIWPFENKLSQYIPELSQFGHARENIGKHGNIPCKQRKHKLVICLQNRP